MITSQGGSISWRTTQNPTGHDYGHHMSKVSFELLNKFCLMCCSQCYTVDKDSDNGVTQIYSLFSIAVVLNTIMISGFLFLSL